MRQMDADNEAVYRIRFITTNPDGTLDQEIWGPYDGLATVKAIVTREKNLDRGYENPSPWTYEWIIEQADHWTKVDDNA